LGGRKQPVYTRWKMGWCSDIDLVTYSVYSDMAWDEYLGNEDLLQVAYERHDTADVEFSVTAP
jgi:hypothetical protein